MAVLWLKFSDEASLPFPLTEAERAKLDGIYNASDKNSVWNRACALLGMPTGSGALIRWVEGSPYVNWSAMTATISCGSMNVVPEGQGYGYAARKVILRIPALVRCQWRTTQYVDQKLAEALPTAQDYKLLESTTLGLALQAVMMRLPTHTPAQLASWLAAPDTAPSQARSTVRRMQEIQKRRTQLSSAWFELFPKRDGGEPPGPEFFWDEPPASQPQPTTAHQNVSVADAWQGLPVCGGRVTGRVFIVRRLKDFTPPGMSDFSVLVFPKAKPDTTEVFQHAAALLFAEGGAMSHACTIAREQGIPCVTGLGVEFLERVENLSANGSVFLTLDGATGTVSIARK